MTDPSQEPDRPSGTTAQAVPQPRMELKIRHFVALFVWAVVLGLFLYFFPTTRLVVLGVLAAGCLASALRPLVDIMPGPRAARAMLAGIVPFVLLGSLIWLSGWLVQDDLAAEVQQWPQLEKSINDMLAKGTRWMGLDEPLSVQKLMTALGEFLTAEEGTAIVRTTAGAAAGLVVAILFVLFGTIYLLIEPRGRLLSPVLRMLPPGRRGQVSDAMECLEPRLRWWIIGTALSMTAVGVTTWIGFKLIGLQLALPLAVLAGVSEIVPNVGPFAAFLVAVLFAAAQGKLLGVIVVWLAVQMLESYVLLPFIMKKAVKIPPFVTLISVIFWGKLFGLIGVLLAIPLNLVVWSFAEQFLLHRYDLELPGGAEPPAEEASK